MKKILFIAMVLCFGLSSCYDGLHDAYDAGEDTASVKIYKLRERGPAGGWIFYINPNAEADGWTYLEMASGVDGWKVWGAGGLNVSTSSSIGSGLQNTENILTADSTTDSAAKYCDSYSITNSGIVYDDWFLPSEDELKKLLKNLKNGPDDNEETFTAVSETFYTSYYSSTQQNLTNAIFVFSSSGSSSGATKASGYESVRPVRRF